MIILKSNKEMDLMDKANSIVHSILDAASEILGPGMTTKDLNDRLEKKLGDFEGRPAFKGYYGFPCSTCISVNEEVVHGIPNDRVIEEGDLVSVDFGVEYKGYYGDAARTFIVGEYKSDKDKALVENTYKSLMAGIDQMRVGNRLSDICKAIEKVGKENRYGIVRNMGGHGIGKVLHDKPFVPNVVSDCEEDIRLQEGLVLALEPMFNMGSADWEKDNDGWTIRTKDNSRSAHWELSIAIINGNAKVLGK